MKLVRELSDAEVARMGGGDYDPTPYNALVLDLRQSGAAGGYGALEDGEEASVTKRRLSMAARSHVGMALKWRRSKNPRELVFVFAPLKPSRTSKNGAVKIVKPAKVAATAS